MQTKQGFAASETEVADLHRIDLGDALGAIGEVERLGQIVQHHPHDLAKAQCDDGQVIATQLERRRTQQHAEQTGHACAQRQNYPRRPMQPEVR